MILIRAFLLLSLLAGCESAPTEPKHPEGGYGAPIIWQLSDDDTTIYLFGSIHALPEDLEWRTPQLNAAFDAADTFCIETDADGQAEEYIDYIRQFGFFENGETLTDFLTEEQAGDIFEIADAVRVSRDYINAMKPWNVMLDLGQRMGELLGHDPSHGVEFTLLPEARARGMTICEMEDSFYTVTSTANLPLDIQIAVLTHEPEAYRDIDDLEATLEVIRQNRKKIVDEWLRGDIAAMEAEDVLDEYGHLDYYDAIIRKRNRNWIPRIEALLDEPGVKFVTVGAAHLFGPDSIVTMLREKGYVVDGP